MKKCLFAFSLVIGMVGFSFAQTDDNDDTHLLSVIVQEVAIIDIEPSGSKDFTFTFAPPTEAGLSLTNPTPNNTLWLNYSSIKSASDPTRSVLVKLSTAVSGGISFTVFALPSIGGVGTLAGIAPPVSLTTTNQSVLGGIGSAYTGNGPGAGHQLLYTTAFSPGSYGDIRASNQAITVTYTLTDNP
jgi:hypothetical protein